MLFRSDRKSTRLNSSHTIISYAVFCLKKKKNKNAQDTEQTQCTHNVSLTRLTAHALLARPADTQRDSAGVIGWSFLLFFFFFNDTATTEIYTLSLHDALPI